MNRRLRTRTVLLPAVVGLALLAASLGFGCGQSTQASAAPQTAGRPGTGSGSATQGSSSAYTIEQAISDRAQENTIAFDALGFLTGTLGSDSFFPPGKVADFWGFQYLRDNDPSQMGHNTDFLTSASLNMLTVLGTDQRAKLVALAKSQVQSINDYGYKRFVLMKAFRRLLEGDLPAGTTGLNEDAVKAYSAQLYQLDGQISYQRAQVMGPILGALTSDQRAHLDAMVGKGMSAWPKVDEPAELKGLSHDEKVAVMTYAGDMFSWYAGSIDADVYFCPERHGTYFGSFYLKDAPAVGNAGYSISTTLTNDLGSALLGKLTSSQALLISSLVDIQRPYLTRIVDTRRGVATELRKSRTGAAVDETTVNGLMKTYGELDGTIVYNLATNFAKVGASLTAAEKSELMALRTQLLGGLSTPNGAYLYSEPIAMPEIPNTDFLFGTGSSAGSGGTTGGSTDGAPLASFSDISTSPYRAAIEQMAARGAISGFADGTFRPTAAVTRAQFAKMIVKALGYPVSASDSCLFTDVPPALDPSDPLYPRAYVSVCAARGITLGTSSPSGDAATFSPAATITRAQLITMVARAATLTEPPSGYSPPFADFSSQHYQWARKAAYAGLLGGLQGVGAGYDFWAAATRGECAQLLSNLLSANGSAGSLSSGTGGSGEFALTSAAVVNGRLLPQYSCEPRTNGAEESIPLAWVNVPASAKSLAIMMYHYPDPNNTSKVNQYLLLWGIDPSVTEIPYGRAEDGPWCMGSNKDGTAVSYTSPCSKGPGPKEYIITIYALSELPSSLPEHSTMDVTYDVLKKAISTVTVVGTATLTFVNVT